MLPNPVSSGTEVLNDGAIVRHWGEQEAKTSGILSKIEEPEH